MNPGHFFRSQGAAVSGRMVPAPVNGTQTNLTRENLFNSCSEASEQDQREAPVVTPVPAPREDSIFQELSLKDQNF